MADHDSGRADAEPQRSEPEDHPRYSVAPRLRRVRRGLRRRRDGTVEAGAGETGGAGEAGVGRERRRGGSGRRLLTPAHPRVHAPVDLLADALDEPFRDRGIVMRAKFGMGRYGGGDLGALVVSRNPFAARKTGRWNHGTVRDDPEFVFSGQLAG